MVMGFKSESKKTKCNICLDVSHSALASYYLEENFFELTKDLGKCVKHIHLSDAIGNSQEGLDIGEGGIDFLKFHKTIYSENKTIFLIPEIWQGHLNNGYKFANSISEEKEASKDILSWLLASINPATRKLSSILSGSSFLIFFAKADP